MSEEPLKRSPLFAFQKSLGARFVPFAGWEMPVQFQGLVIEHHAVRQRAGLFDVTHMGRLRIEGADALTQVDRLVTNSLAHSEDGRAVYGCCCSESGGILDDLICYRESKESIFVICNASNRLKIHEHFLRNLGSSVVLRDVSDQTGLLALQGPSTVPLLDALSASWANQLPRMGFGKGLVADVEVTVAKTGYTGEFGVELVCERDRVEILYRALLEAGAAFGLIPAGLGCRDTLRLEARLSLYGNEIDESTNPFEAGLAWTVKLDKADFVGKEALAAIRRTGPRRVIVGLEMLGHGVARHGYPVVDATRRPVGKVTSGGPSPTLGKSIALAYVPLEAASVGTKLQVDCRGKLVGAVVVPTPFYKRPSLG